jgi:hypothetical protein
MHWVAGFLDLIGAIGLICSWLFILERKQVATSRLRKTGDIAAGARYNEADELIATEGNVVGDATVEAPVSGRRCLFFRLVITRSYRSSGDESSLETERIEGGARFSLDDGSGPVLVDASKDASVVDQDLTRTFRGTKNFARAEAEVRFGNLSLSANRLSNIRVEEHILTPEGKLYVAGRFVDGAIASPPGVAYLIVSRGGREARSKRAKKAAIVWFVIAAVFISGSVPVWMGPSTYGMHEGTNHAVRK